MTDERTQSEAILDGRFGAKGRPWDFVSPYGATDVALPDRLAAWSRKFRTPNPNVPFFGGLIADLEAAMRLLNVREYIQYLEVHGDDDQRRWAAEMLEIIEENEESDQTFADIERVVPVADEQPYAEAVEAVAKKAIQYDVLRSVLEQVGALAPGDTETDIPALLRALLS